MLNKKNLLNILKDKILYTLHIYFNPNRGDLSSGTIVEVYLNSKLIYTCSSSYVSGEYFTTQFEYSKKDLLEVALYWYKDRQIGYDIEVSEQYYNESLNLYMYKLTPLSNEGTLDVSCMGAS